MTDPNTTSESDFEPETEYESETETESTSDTAEGESDSALPTSRRGFLMAMAAGAAAGSTLAQAQPAAAQQRPLDLVPEDQVTHRATQSGSWDDNGVWEGNSQPGDGAHVMIDPGVVVTLRHEDTARLKTVRVDGTLRFDQTTDTHLQADTIITHPDSTLEIGTQDVPVGRGNEARVTFIDTGPIDEDWDPDRMSRGMLSHGAVVVQGAPKTEWTELASFPEAGDAAIHLPEAPENWTPGDEIVIPGLTPNENQDEERVIEAVDGSTVHLDAALQHDHVPPRSDFDAYALNLSRNIVFESESEEIPRRGHTMLMGSETAEISYARYHELGRTDKRQYITNPVRNADQVPDDLPPNPSARYSLHWHLTGSGAENPHVVKGVVADGSPGWGIVNHHSYAEVTDSITYDVLGAGFVAEGGNERGVFARNFALRSEGSGEPIDSRSAGQGRHSGDPQIDDFGHAGHGFWMQSPMVEMVDNVAAGHRHFGIVYWTRPLLDHVGGLAEEVPEQIEDSRVTYVPNTPMEWLDDRQEPLLEAIEEGRFTNDDRDQLMWETQKVPTSFVLLRRVEGNAAFASAGGLDVSRNHFKWKHERFSDFSTVEDLTVYNIGPFINADGEEVRPDPPIHIDSGHQGNGGGVGVAFRYMSNISLVDSTIIGSDEEGSIGAPFHDYLWTRTIDNSEITNWDWGVAAGEHRLDWIRNNVFSENQVDVGWTFDTVAPAILDGNDLNTVRHKFELLNQKSSEVFEFEQQSGVRVDGRSSHVADSAPDYVPFESEDDLSGINSWRYIFDTEHPDQIVGLTNQELMDEYGIAVGGALMPDDAEAVPFMDDGHLLPRNRSPETGVYLDTANADDLGAFETVSEPDAAGNTAVRATGSDAPKENPLSIDFDSAGGTFRLFARVWPDAWNGDTVSFRIDGGEWKDAEKLKTPIGFRWHDAAPRGGDEYTWDLSEGTHTLEIAAGNDGVRLDEVFVTSDTQVLGAYGMSQDSVPEEPEAPEQAPYTDHDLSRIEAEDFDTGGEGVAYSDAGDGNAGGAYRDTNVDIEPADDEGGGYNIGWTSPGEWWEYTVDVPEGDAGEYDLQARVAGKDAASIDVAVDGEQRATVDVPATGGWQDWVTVSAGTVALEAGTHTIRLTSNGYNYNLNWFGFAEPTEEDPGVPVEIRGDGAAAYNPTGAIRYILETSGTLTESDNLENEDLTGDSRATGLVEETGTAADTFILRDGEVTDVSAWGGDVTVTVDGTEWTG